MCRGRKAGGRGQDRCAGAGRLVGRGRTGVQGQEGWWTGAGPVCRGREAGGRGQDRCAGAGRLMGGGKETGVRG